MTDRPTASDIMNVLAGAEHTNLQETRFSASFAVNFGAPRAGNSSGISFGITQQDIGNNSDAAARYETILNDALQSGTISSSEHSRLIRYSGVERPDLNIPGLTVESFRSDLSLLTDTVFSQPEAQRQINYGDAHRVHERYFRNEINAAVDAGQSADIFSRGSEDYSIAISAVVSYANRVGNTNDLEQFIISRGSNITVEDLRSFYESRLPGSWPKVERGASTMDVGELPGMWPVARPEESCFGAGTPIDMWPLDPSIQPGPDGLYNEAEVRAKIWTKPIEQITPNDWVVSFDSHGHLKPGKVTRTMTNEAKILLDFHGTFVTPGHVYYRADSKKQHKYETLIDILRDDGIIQHQDGTLIRASTGVEVGTPDDEEFHAFLIYTDEQGNERVRDKTKLRFGTRFMREDGNHFTMRHYMEAIGVEIVKDGPREGYARVIKTGVTMPFAWTLSETLPQPEDFVLARSGTTLEAIYKAGQWEQQRPTKPAPMVMDGGPVQPLPEHKLHLMPRNEPMAFRSAAPSSQMLPERNGPQLNRKQRKAMEVKQRKAAKTQRKPLH